MAGSKNAWNTSKAGVDNPADRYSEQRYDDGKI